MTPIPPSDLSVSFSEDEWLRFVTSEKRRPNLLVSCFNSGVGPVVTRLMNVCARPLHIRHLPGALNLPEELTGTVLLWDVAQLTLDQQMELYGWMGSRRQDAQVISVTSARLPRLVESGQFHEGLFYRLNVVSLQARVGESRTAPRPNPRSYELLPPASGARRQSARQSAPSEGPSRDRSRRIYAVGMPVSSSSSRRRYRQAFCRHHRHPASTTKMTTSSSPMKT